MDDKKLTFSGHLGELRRALMVSGLAVLVGVVIGVIFSDYLDMALRLPIEGLLPAGSDQPVYLGIFEPIFYRLKLGFIGGLLLASLALPFILAASFFFIGGAAFCYFVVLPKAAAFSIGQMTDQTRIILSLKSYFSNASMFILAFGVVFETPVIVFLICLIGLVTPKTLGRFRKYVLLAAFIIAAIVTPTPDAMNQTIMALPIYILYELGMLAARLVIKKKERGRDKKE